MKKDTQKLQHYIEKRLREKREILGVSLAQISDQLHISEEQFKKYSCGHSRIPSTLLYQIAAILKVDINYFFEGFSYSTPSTKSHKKTLLRPDQNQPLKVLLIDDNTDDIVLTTKAFDASPTRVTLSSIQEGPESLRFLHNLTTNQLRPDVILLDLYLPTVPGITILHELKEDHALSDIPVIILSGSMSTEEILTCYREHASGFMIKPFDIELYQTNIDIFAHYWAQTVVLPNR